MIGWLLAPYRALWELAKDCAWGKAEDIPDRRTQFGEPVECSYEKATGDDRLHCPACTVPCGGMARERTLP